MILTIDRVNDLLDDMADSFPAALFDGLNGGINLLEEAKPDPEFPEGEMYILGEYCDDLLGQYITCTTAPLPPLQSGRTGARKHGRTSYTPPCPMS